MKKVFVNGYGSIGSRIIQFIKDDPEIELVGVGKYSPDSKVTDALSRGFKVYVPEKNQNAFSDFTITGNIEAALDESDLVIDASPGGVGFKNKKLFNELKYNVDDYDYEYTSSAKFHHKLTDIDSNVIGGYKIGRNFQDFDKIKDELWEIIKTIEKY